MPLCHTLTSFSKPYGHNTIVKIVDVVFWGGVVVVVVFYDHLLIFILSYIYIILIVHFDKILLV